MADRDVAIYLGREGNQISEMEKEKSRARQPTMTVAPIFAALLLLSIAFAGCINSGNGHQEPDQTSIWEVGRYWNYEIKGALPADWMKDTVGEDAWDFGHKPKMPIDTSVTLVASIQDDVKGSIFESYKPRKIYADDLQVPFLHRYGLPFADQWVANESIIESHQTTFVDFPIYHGKEWDTEFMGVNINIKVHETNGTFKFMGMDSKGRELVEYTYDESANWFGDFAILNLEGETILTAELNEGGKKYSGTFYVLSVRRTAHCIDGSQFVGPGSCKVETNLPNEGIYAWWIDLSFYGEGPGSVIATQSTPDSQDEIWFQSQCPCDERMQLFEIEEQLGDYTWTINHAFTGEWFMSFLHVDACFVKFEVTKGWTSNIPLHEDQC